MRIVQVRCDGECETERSDAIQGASGLAGFCVDTEGMVVGTWAARRVDGVQRCGGEECGDATTNRSMNEKLKPRERW